MPSYVATGGLGITGVAAERVDRIFVASGKLSLRRCGPYVVFTPRRVRAVYFLPGEKAWLLFKAEVGIVEYVYVKKVNVTEDLLIVTYIDTFNRVYNEWDLVGETTAVQVATAYLELRLRQASRAVCS
jgi:hypothetical protein